MSFLTDEQKAACVERLKAIRDVSFRSESGSVKIGGKAPPCSATESIVEVSLIKSFLEVNKFLLDEYEGGP